MGVYKPVSGAMLSRKLSVVAAAIAALMLLVPPWRKAAVDGGDFLGYLPLFDGPSYTVAVPAPPTPQTNGEPLSLGQLLSRPVISKAATIAWGTLITQWLVLTVIVTALILLRSQNAHHEKR